MERYSGCLRFSSENMSLKMCFRMLDMFHSLSLLQFMLRNVCFRSLTLTSSSKWLLTPLKVYFYPPMNKVVKNAI